MIDTLTSTPFFGLGATLLCWYLAVRFQKRTGLLICNPVLVASLLVIGIMLLFHIPLDNYNAGGSIIKLLLAPATAVLALNIYQQRAILKRNFWPVVLGCFVGSLVSMLLVQVLCRLFQAEASLLNSLLPKSVTTAIAVSIAESSGGLPALTAASLSPGSRALCWPRCLPRCSMSPIRWWRAWPSARAAMRWAPARRWRSVLFRAP